MRRLCTALVLTFLTAPPLAHSQTEAPATPPPRPKFEAKRVAIFAHYGDLNQQYDATPGSEDRRSSYEMPEAAFVGAPAVLADTDNPAAGPDRCFPFVLSGYTPFDPRTLIAGSLRFDLLVSDFEQATEWALELLSAEGSHATIFKFGNGLRDALAASNQIRPQWLALNFDLATGELSAQEIDPFGRPIRGREYPMIGIDGQAIEQTAAVLNENKIAIQQVAGKGSLCGIVSGGARLSFVSLNVTALPSGPSPTLPPRWIQVQRGHQGRGSPSSLSHFDDDSLSLAPETADGAFISEIRCTFIVHKALLESAGEDATIRVVGAISGALPPTIKVNVEKPASEELVPLKSQSFGIGFGGHDALDFRLPRWRQLLGPSDLINIRIRVARSIFIDPDAKVASSLYRLASRPEISLNLCQLKFEIPPTEPIEPTTPPTTPAPPK